MFDLIPFASYEIYFKVLQRAMKKEKLQRYAKSRHLCFKDISICQRHHLVGKL